MINSDVYKIWSIFFRLIYVLLYWHKHWIILFNSCLTLSTPGKISEDDILIFFFFFFFFFFGFYAPNLKEVGGAYCFWVIYMFFSLLNTVTAQLIVYGHLSGVLWQEIPPSLLQLVWRLFSNVGFMLILMDKLLFPVLSNISTKLISEIFLLMRMGPSYCTHPACETIIIINKENSVTF